MKKRLKEGEITNTEELKKLEALRNALIEGEASGRTEYSLEELLIQLDAE